MNIGLVGLGRMGSAMAHRLKDKGFAIAAWDIAAAARAREAAAGLSIAANPADVARQSEIVISIITEDKGAKRNFTGPGGFLSADIKGKLFIEMSTLQPMTHRELAPLVKAKGAALIDAPVLGTIPQVKDGKLFALVGGEEADVARARAVLEPITRRILHLGPNGAGCAMKLAANLGMAIYVQALAEGMALGLKENLSLEQILDVFSEMPIASLFLKNKLGILKGDAGDMSLDIKTLRKDVLSAIATGTLSGVPMPATTSTLGVLSSAVAAGWGEKDLAEAPRYFREFLLQNFD